MPDDDQSSALAVSILWVGLNRREAGNVLYATLESDFRELDPASAISTPSPGVDLYVDHTGGDTAIVRVGETLVRIDGAGSLQATRLLALEIARHLQRAT